jgi:intracellular sulfur oxidation DsrE/DsrF family protein
MFRRTRIVAASLALAGALAFVPPVTVAGTGLSDPPKVVFLISDAANAGTILRFVTNYLVAEPTARVAVVGYASGIDFMLAGARDSYGNAYQVQLQALAGRGVEFKVCNNTLKSRNLGAEAVAAEASVVPSAVNEVIRLQTRDAYAYFQHVK